MDALFVHGALSYLAVAVLKLLLVTGLRIWRPEKTTALGEQVVAETKGTAIAAVTYGDQIHNNIVVHVAIGVRTTEEGFDTRGGQKSWHETAFGKIFIGITIPVAVALIMLFIRHYFSGAPV